jgi:hypothetical protein
MIEFLRLILHIIASFIIRWHRAAAGVCQAHHRSARLHSDFRAEPHRARDERGRHVRSLDRQRYRTEGPVEAVGVDRLIVPNGYVAENLILSDHPIFADFARYVRDLRSA